MIQGCLSLLLGVGLSVGAALSVNDTKQRVAAHRTRASTFADRGAGQRGVWTSLAIEQANGGVTAHRAGVAAFANGIAQWRRRTTIEWSQANGPAGTHGTGRPPFAHWTADGRRGVTRRFIGAHID